MHGLEQTVFRRIPCALGAAGRNGCIVRDLGKLEEASIRSFFLEHGVEQNATEKELWWKHNRYGFHHAY